MASIKVILEDPNCNKTGEITVTKETRDGTLVYIVEETVYDGGACQTEYDAAYAEWQSSNHSSSMPVKRDATLIAGRTDQKRIVFKKLASVYAFLYQNLYWQVDESDSCQFDITVYYGDTEVDSSDNSGMDLAEFKTMLEHYLCMFNDDVPE